MLRDYPMTPSLATADAQRAKRWYRDHLGLEPAFEDRGYLGYRLGAGMFTVYETPAAGTARNTVINYNVADLDAEVARLRARGVAFEDYDFGEYKTENGILRDPSGFGDAWFKDPDGNTWSVLSDPNAPRPTGVSAMLAASDIERAGAWYRDVLGFDDPTTYPGGILEFASGGGSFELYRTDFAGTARNTVGAWNVEDLRAEKAWLESRGVAFERYDLGELQTVDGVLTDPGGGLNAWFTDSEGNILALVQYEMAG